MDFTFWDILRNLLLATRWTILLSIAAFVGGAVLGMAVLLARVSDRYWPRRFAESYIGLFQGTPLLMQLFLVFFGLPLPRPGLPCTNGRTDNIRVLNGAVYVVGNTLRRLLSRICCAHATNPSSCLLACTQGVVKALRI